MSQLIPVTNDARQTFTTILDSQKVRFIIYYLEDYIGNSKNGWFCDFILLSETPKIIVTGQRLQSLAQIAKSIISDFSGSIFIIPITAPSQDLTSTSPWGITHQLVFFTEDEVSNAQVI